MIGDAFTCLIYISPVFTKPLHKIQLNLQNWCIQENAFENIACKMAVSMCWSLILFAYDKARV